MLAPVLTPAADAPVAWEPQAGSQEWFLDCPIFEVLYSGTRGPGKSDALLMDFLQHVGEGWGREWRGILFRSQHKDLNDIIDRSLKWFPIIFPAARFNSTKSQWRFPAGETLLFRHMRVPSDYQAYHGHMYSWIGWEELTSWPNDVCYKLMMSCCRSTVPGMPRKVRATTNPYGIGHNWCKMRFQLPGMAHKVIREPGKPERVAIFGYLAENKILLKGDPHYLTRIREAARNPAELEAWVNGSWDIVAGGMFDDVWDPNVHVVEPFPIPHTWKIDRSFDWGSSKPFSVGWWAESDGSIAQTSRGPLHTVRGDLFRIHEWYGWTGKPNEGLRMTAGQIAAGIVERELQWGIHDRVVPGAADASIFDEENDNCIADDMAEPVRVNGKDYAGVAWEPADKSPGSRKQGWEQLRKRLKNSAHVSGEPREHPGLFVFRGRCPAFAVVKKRIGIAP